VVLAEVDEKPLFFADSSQILVRLGSSEGVIYFRRYRLSNGDYGVELRIPKTSWSEEFWDKLLDHCASHRASHRIESERSGVSESLVMELGENTPRAADNVIDLLTQVLGVSPSDELTYKIVGVPKPKDGSSILSILR